MVIKVIALDPGLTSGFATGKIERGKMTVAVGQQRWTHQELYQALDDWKPDRIVVERFDYRRKQNRDNLELYPRELIGIVNLWVAQHPGVKLHEQSAAHGKGYFTNDKLKDAQVYVPGLPHAMDALRHLLQWYQFGPGYQFNQEGFVAA